MTSDAANQWTKFYTETTEMMYPAEAVIRIFKGSYPNLTMPTPKPGDSILDVGCGDGRHFPLFQSLGLKMAGSEITTEIADTLAARLGVLGIAADIRPGTCATLPWPDATFDFLLTWNSCYYMGPAVSSETCAPGGYFEDHVAEMARVIKPGGWLVSSVPKKTCFIFRGSDESRIGYRTIRDDHFGLRNGVIMRCFAGPEELTSTFVPHFTNFSHASIDIDMFGLAYNWHVFTAERRTL